MSIITATFNLAYEPFGFGLYKDADIITECYQRSSRKFSETLVDRLKEECAVNNISYDSLSAVGLIKGPGSYTGLRISVSVAKTIAYALNIPVFSCTALQAISLQATVANKTYITVVPSKRGFVYVQLFNCGSGLGVEDVTEPICITIEQFLHLISAFKAPMNIVGILDEETKKSVEEIKDIYFFESYILCKTLHTYIVDCLKRNVKSEFNHIKPFYFHEPNIGIIKKKNSKFKSSY
jgi:tRNA threonylcarbamoyl adenosine modification protein YeaZ